MKGSVASMRIRNGAGRGGRGRGKPPKVEGPSVSTSSSPEHNRLEECPSASASQLYQMVADLHTAHSILGPASTPISVTGSGHPPAHASSSSVPALLPQLQQFHSAPLVTSEHCAGAMPGGVKGLKWKWMRDFNKEKEERERRAQEEAEQTAKEQQRLADEKLAHELAEQLAQEEQERQDKEVEEQRLAMMLEQEQVAAEAARMAQERAELRDCEAVATCKEGEWQTERQVAEEVVVRLAQQEAEQLAREGTELSALGVKHRAEEEVKAQLQAGYRAKEEAEAKAKEAADRLAKEEVERKAKEEQVTQERKVREEQHRRMAEVAARKPAARAKQPQDDELDESLFTLLPHAPKPSMPALRLEQDRVTYNKKARHSAVVSPFAESAGEQAPDRRREQGGSRQPQHPAPSSTSDRKQDPSTAGSRHGKPHPATKDAVGSGGSTIKVKTDPTTAPDTKDGVAKDTVAVSTARAKSDAVDPAARASRQEGSGGAKARSEAAEPASRNGGKDSTGTNKTTIEAEVCARSGSKEGTASIRLKVETAEPMARGSSRDSGSAAARAKTEASEAPSRAASMVVADSLAERVKRKRTASEAPSSAATGAEGAPPTVAQALAAAAAAAAVKAKHAAVVNNAEVRAAPAALQPQASASGRSAEAAPAKGKPCSHQGRGALATAEPLRAGGSRPGMASLSARTSGGSGGATAGADPDVAPSKGKEESGRSKPAASGVAPQSSSRSDPRPDTPAGTTSKDTSRRQAAGGSTSKERDNCDRTATTPAPADAVANVAQSGKGGGSKRPAEPTLTAEEDGSKASGKRLKCAGQDVKAPAISFPGPPPEHMVECYIEGIIGDASAAVVTVGAGTSFAQAAVDLGKLRSFKELWNHLAAVFPTAIPDRFAAKLVYLDGDGEWMKVGADERWSTFVSAAVKILVSAKC